MNKKHRCQWRVTDDWGHAGGFDFDLEQCSVGQHFRVQVYHSPEINSEVEIDLTWVKRIRECASPKERKEILLEWFNQR